MKKIGLKPEDEIEEKEVPVACMTADFAMQVGSMACMFKCVHVDILYTYIILHSQASYNQYEDTHENAWRKYERRIDLSFAFRMS